MTAPSPRRYILGTIMLALVAMATFATWYDRSQSNLLRARLLGDSFRCGLPLLTTPLGASTSVPERASTQLPAEGMPWRDVHHRLAAAARSCDAAAAARLCRDTLRCRDASTLEAQVSRAVAAYPGSSRPLSVMTAYDQQLKSLRDEIERAAPVCRDAPPAEVQAEIPYLLIAAAKAGNATARSCFLEGSVLQAAGAPSSSSSDELFSTYAANAPQFALDGLRQGDWRVVTLLESAYGPADDPYQQRGWFGRLVAPSPRAVYSLIELRRLAATDPENQAALSAMLDQTARAGKLEPADVAAAQQWAADASKAFIGHPYPSVIRLCEIDDF